MTTPIPLRDFVVSGLVEEATVNALLAFGEPMLSEDGNHLLDLECGWIRNREYRAWIRLRGGGRAFGQFDFTPQFAADRLLRKLRGER